MKRDELIDMWQEGSDRMFRDEKTDKKMIEQYLSEKTLKGTRSIKFNLIFYGLIQLVTIILLSMNLAGYMSNPTMIWILVPQLIITIGVLIYSINVFYKFKEINNYSESLKDLIEKQLWFFKRPYEIWLILASVSIIILISNVNLYIDNDNGSYAINHKVVFVAVTLATFLFIYGTQKISHLHLFKTLKAYLSDLQEGALEQSDRMEKSKKKYIWLWVAIFILLTASLAFGIIAASRV